MPKAKPARVERGSSRRIIVMRYPTRAYQHDHRRECRTWRAVNEQETGAKKNTVDSRSLHISRGDLPREPGAPFPMPRSLADPMGPTSRGGGGALPSAHQTDVGGGIS